MNLSEKLTFGRHKDKSLIDIWRGMYHNIDKKNVNDFVENTIDYFFNITKFNEKILSTGYSFSNEDIELIEYLRQNSNLRDTFQVKQNTISIKSTDNIYIERFVNFLIFYFNYSHFTEPHFKALKHPQNENEENIIFTTESKKIAETIPEPSYIQWCLDNTELVLSDRDLLMLKNTESFYPFILLNKTSSLTIEVKCLAYIQFHNK